MKEQLKSLLKKVKKVNNWNNAEVIIWLSDKIGKPIQQYNDSDYELAISLCNANLKANEILS